MSTLVPEKNTTWLHHKTNNIYQVLEITKGAGKLHGETIVVYQDIQTKALYTRPVTEWELHFIKVDKVLQTVRNWFNETAEAVGKLLESIKVSVK